MDFLSADLRGLHGLRGVSRYEPVGYSLLERLVHFKGLLRRARKISATMAMISTKRATITVKGLRMTETRRAITHNATFAQSGSAAILLNTSTEAPFRRTFSETPSG
jgi:hypothetical protein